MHEFTNEDYYAILHLKQKAEQMIELRKREYAKAGTNECVRINEWHDAFKELEQAVELLQNQIKKTL